MSEAAFFPWPASRRLARGGDDARLVIAAALVYALRGPSSCAASVLKLLLDAEARGEVRRLPGGPCRLKAALPSPLDLQGLRLLSSRRGYNNG
jgi:hypothetical protein